MAFVRSIGRLGLTALVVNTIIGSGIFGVPSELIRLVGRASPLAMIAGGLGMAFIMVCVVEVGSQFSEPGGAYLYTSTAFGRFAGMQIGWLTWIAAMAAAAANANLFVIYFAGFVPLAAAGPGRAMLLAAVVAFPTLANYIGVRSGTRLSTVFSFAKLLPLATLIVLGLLHFGAHAEIISSAELTQPGAFAWGQAILLLVFSYGGYENALLPSGEVTDPRCTVPFSFLMALLICVVVYTLIQFVTVAALGNNPSDRPLAAAANIFLGRGGSVFISIAAMISTYGFVSAMTLNGPRLTYSLAERGDFPRFFAAVHPKFLTPHNSIVAYGLLTFLFAFSGSFRWALAVGSGAILINYASICAALIRLRRIQPLADAFRVPFGQPVAALCVVVTLALLSTLTARQALFLGLTAAVAALNWWWVSRHPSAAE